MESSNNLDFDVSSLRIGRSRSQSESWNKVIMNKIEKEISNRRYACFSSEACVPMVERLQRFDSDRFKYFPIKVLYIRNDYYL